MNRNRFVVAASCCAAVAIAGSGGDCIPNSNSCSCFDGTAQNIVDWRQVVNFNDCCATCVVTAASAEGGCLNDNSCNYDDAKGAFESCGASGWPTEAPAGFEPPKSCEFFDPQNENQLVNWRTDNAPFCLTCVVGQLQGLSASTLQFTAQQTIDAYNACGTDPDSWTGASIPTAFVLPQSFSACDTGDVRLTPEQLVAWRDGGVPTDCVTCFTNRLQAGEYAYNGVADFGGVAGAVAACGYQYVGELAAALTPDQARDAGFIPPGCGNFLIGSDPDFTGIATGQPQDVYCTQCIDAVANGTINGKLYPGLDNCTPGQSNCNYDQTAAAFNYCGTGGYWAGALDPSALGDVWPSDAPIANPYTIP